MYEQLKSVKMNRRSETEFTFDKVTVAELLKEFSAFDGTRWFSAVFTIPSFVCLCPEVDKSNPHPHILFT